MKGAARPACIHYRPPNYKDIVEPVNLFETYIGRLWEHDQGRCYLNMLMELGVAMHNVSNRTRDAVSVFQEMIAIDPSDHLVSVIIMLYLVMYLCNKRIRKIFNNFLVLSMH